MTLSNLEFLASVDKEFLTLPKPPQRVFQDKLVYLLLDPFRSYPWLRVHQSPRHPGEWRFHLGHRRVFYRVDGLTVVVTRVLDRPGAYPRRPPKLPRVR